MGWFKPRLGSIPRLTDGSTSFEHLVDSSYIEALIVPRSETIALSCFTHTSLTPAIMKIEGRTFLVSGGYVLRRDGDAAFTCAARRAPQEDGS